ncbi:hypothetical protein D9M68_787180 [compost metagenome]
MRRLIKSLLFFGCRGSRFEGQSEGKVIAIRDASDDASCMIGSGMPIVIQVSVIMFRAHHPGGSKACTELNAFYCWYREHGLCHTALNTIPEGFTPANRHLFNRTGYDTAYAVFGSNSFLQRSINILQAAGFGNHCFKSDITQDLFGNHASSYNACGQPGAEMPATPVIFKSTEFFMRYKVGMSRTVKVSLFSVCLRSGIIIFK